MLLPHSNQIPFIVPEAKFNIQTYYVVLDQKSSLKISISNRRKMYTSVATKYTIQSTFQEFEL